MLKLIKKFFKKSKSEINWPAPFFLTETKVPADLLTAKILIITTTNDQIEIILKQKVYKIKKSIDKCPNPFFYRTLLFDSKLTIEYDKRYLDFVKDETIYWDHDIESPEEYYYTPEYFLNFKDKGLLYIDKNRTLNTDCIKEVIIQYSKSTTELTKIVCQ